MGTLAFSTVASATTLTTKLAVDNGFVAYLSTSDNTAGTQFGSGNDWGTTYVNSVNLGTASQYFLHIQGYDQGGVASLLGEFSLSGTGYHFADGSTTLLSGSSLLTANAVGFNGSYTSTTLHGSNGADPWGIRPNISANAKWAWSGDYDANNVSYFTAAIVKDAPSSNVPEPASLGLLGVGLLAAGALRSRVR